MISTIRTTKPHYLQVLVTAAVLTASGMVGCSTENSFVRSKLDPQTSVTISYIRSPMVFYRDVPSRSDYARDFVELGPLEVNRSGSYRYFLWFGAWNILQDDRDGTPGEDFSAIVLFADGEPLALEIDGQTPNVIGASEAVYPKSIGSATDAYYEVTLDQLRLIVDAKDLQLQTTGPRGDIYDSWGEQNKARAGFIEFLGEAEY